MRSALESLVGLQANPAGRDTLRFCHGSGFEFELGPASPSDSWVTGPEGIPNTRYLPLNLGSAAQVGPNSSGRLSSTLLHGSCLPQWNPQEL